MTSNFTIEDYERLSGKKVPENKRDMVAARILAAIAYISDDCCDKFVCFAEDGTEHITLPESVFMGVVLLVNGMALDPNVSSYSLAGMSKSYFQGGDHTAAARYWKKYSCGGEVLFF